VEGRGACRHPDGAARLARSAIDAFAAELVYHARNGPCERCHMAGELLLPGGGAPTLALLLERANERHSHRIVST
jgi:hypothetical protein